MVKETGKRLTKEGRTETYYWVTKLAHIPLYVKGAYPVLHRFAEQHDVEVVIAGPDDSATEPYVQAVYEAIQQGAAGIMVSGWGDEEIIPAVDAAVESGVPVVSVDGDVPGSKRLAHVGTDWFRMGVAMADKLVALMGERGKVLMMGLADLANIQAGFHGFQYRMAAYPDVEVLGPENDIDVGFGKAEAIVTEYLDKHPDLSGIAGFGINSGPGAAMALEKAGMAGKVKLVCTDTEEPHLEYLRAGVIDAAFAQKRETFTYLAFQMVYAYNHGSLITGYQPGPANISGNIDTGHVIVSEENVETFESELSVEEAFAQQQLSRQVALLSNMIENSAELALATDADGYIMYANPASVRLCGFAEEQMLAFSWEEIFDLTDEQREQVAQCMAQARSTSFETLARRKDGSTLPVQLSVSPMTTDATTSGMVLIATNIAERKRAEEALAHERDLLQTLMDNSPDYLFFKDRESRFIRTNRAHAQLLGFDDPQGAIGKTDFDLFPQDDAQRFYDEEQRIMESGQPLIDREWPVPGSEGETLWVSEHKIPITDETGQVVGFVGITRDITARKRAEEALEKAYQEVEEQVEERTAELKREVAERKRAEAALARESELLQALLDNSPDYIFFKDRESRFIRTNKAHAQNLLGVSDPREVEGKTDFDLFPQAEAQRFYDEEQEIMETGQPELGREWSLHSGTTGRLVWLSEHKVPIRDETGRVIGLLGISRDVTQLKRAETEREQLFTTLERRSVQLQAAAEVSRTTSGMLDPNELIQSVVKMIRERFDLYYVGLFLVDQTSGRADKWARLRAGTGEAGRRMVKQRHELRVGEGHSMVGECIAAGEARVEQDVDKAAVHRRNPLLPDTRSELALPLISRGEAIGALTVQSAEPLAFTEEDISILQTMAGQVANAIENTRLYKQTEEALKELETIHRSYIRQSWDSYLKRGR